MAESLEEPAVEEAEPPTDQRRRQRETVGSSTSVWTCEGKRSVALQKAWDVTAPGGEDTSRQDLHRTQPCSVHGTARVHGRVSMVQGTGADSPSVLLRLSANLTLFCSQTKIWPTPAGGARDPRGERTGARGRPRVPRSGS